MRTVKEVSVLTGISARTLHWYDEIGLLKPTAHSEAGYRLYDDKALEVLQQILFFREFGLPLKDIKAAMENPDFDRDSVLKKQRRLLEVKQERLKRLISSMDDILKGENKMDFAVFDKSELRTMCREMLTGLSGTQIDTLKKQYGSLSAYEEQYLEKAGVPKAQETMKKMVEWYGGKETKDPVSDKTDSELTQAYKNRIRNIYRKLADKRGSDVSSFEVKQIIGELDFVLKQFTRVGDPKILLLETADSFSQEPGASNTDSEYGAGTAGFFERAIREFYK